MQVTAKRGVETHPTVERSLPLRGGFTQHGQAGTRVLTPFVVVGGGGQQCAGQALGALGVAGVEGGDGQGPLRRLATHFVAGEQAAVAVERCVLDRLGGSRGGELLEFNHGPRPFLPPRAGRDLAQPCTGQPACHMVQQRPVYAAHRLPCARHGPVQHVLVGRRDACRPGIDAVDVEVDQHLRQHVADGRQRVVARQQVTPGHAMQRRRGLVQFAREVFAQHLAAGGNGFVFEQRRAAGERGPQGRERGLARRVVQQRTQLVHGVIAGRAVGQPVGGQSFVGR